MFIIILPYVSVVWHLWIILIIIISSIILSSIILMYVLFYSFRARFTNSLHQRKLSFGVKMLSGCTKDAQWRISAEKAWTQLFLWLTLLNMHL